MTDNHWKRFCAGENDAGRRLDRIARKLLFNVPLGGIGAAIRTGAVRVNNAISRCNYRLRAGDTISISLPVPCERRAGEEASAESLRTLRRLRATIIFENNHILALNKPRGVTMHGDHSWLATARRHLQSVPATALAFHPSPLHRIDRNTTGLALFSSSLPGARYITRLLHDGLVEKGYIGLLQGSMRHTIHWRDRLHRDQRRRITMVVDSDDGMIANLTVQPLLTTTTPEANALSLCLCRLWSGRTHQIRAQAARHGHSLYGDRKYGGIGSAYGYLLHAWYMVFPEGAPIAIPRRLVAPLPPASVDRLVDIFGKRRVRGVLGRIARLP